MTPEVVVVIPALNAASTIGAQLEALARQEDAPPFEVVVADNGSTDRTVEVAESYADRLRLRVVDASATPGAGPARNHGVRDSAAPLVAFCDADDIVGQRWLRAMAARLGEADFVTGPLAELAADADVADPSTPAAYTTHTFLDGSRYAPSNNAAIRRLAFEAVGGFDARFRLAEDVELSLRVCAAGHQLVFEDGAVVHARLRSSTHGYVRQHFAYGKADVAVYAAHRPAVRRERARSVLRGYAGLVAWLPRVFSSPARRRTWLAPAAKRVGRLAGSARHRVWCP